MTEARFITLDPGHFHAALVQKEMLPGVSSRVHVYAPPGDDLQAHLQRIAGFNSRQDNPSSWQLEVHACEDFLERMLKDRPGNVVILSGKNRPKIDRILAAVKAGMHVLADKPWILVPEDLPKLEQALELAQMNKLVAYDIMTERFEITSILQRILVNDPELFGDVLPGSPELPAVHMESVHYLIKRVAGSALRRPAQFFDIEQQGEGLSDVGTHLVDLVAWILHADTALDPKSDIAMLNGERWPTPLSVADFQELTGEHAFPASVAGYIRDGTLEYYCNNRVLYTVKGTHVRLDVLWGLRPAPGAVDTHFAVFNGSRAKVAVLQDPASGAVPELFVQSQHARGRRELFRAIDAKVSQLQTDWPGIALFDQGERFWIQIPERYRTGHEAHFAEVTRQFLSYLNDPASLPSWERPNMLAKYFVTTSGVRMARRH